MGVAITGIAGAAVLYYKYPEWFPIFKTDSSSSEASTSAAAFPGKPVLSDKKSASVPSTTDKLEAERLIETLVVAETKIQNDVGKLQADFNVNDLSDKELEDKLMFLMKIEISGAAIFGKMLHKVLQAIGKLNETSSEANQELKDEIVTKWEKILLALVNFDLSNEVRERAAELFLEVPVKRDDLLSEIKDAMSPVEVENIVKEFVHKVSLLRQLLIKDFRLSQSGQNIASPTDKSLEQLESEFKREYDERLKEKMSSFQATQAAELESKLASEREKLLIDVECKVADEREQLRMDYAKSIAANQAKLLALETTMEGRKESEKMALYSHYMWLACDNFRKVVHRDIDVDLTSRSVNELESFLKPLHLALRGIEIVNATRGDPFVRSIIESVPPQARSRGIYNEAMLKSRFERVYKSCKRFALIDNNNKSIYAHLLSWLRSSLRIKISKDVYVEGDVTAMDTIELLNAASLAVEHGDFASSVKLLNLVKGEASELVKDWLAEARLYLEVKQAARTLSTFSSATGFSAAIQ